MRRTRHAERAVGVAAVGAQHATLVQGQGSRINNVILVPDQSNASFVFSSHFLEAINSRLANDYPRFTLDHSSGD